MATGPAGLTEAEILSAESGDSFDANASAVNNRTSSTSIIDDDLPSPTPTRRNRTMSA